jgi:hypothetical protein
MKNHALISSLLLTAVLLAPAVASADSAADTPVKNKLPSNAAKPPASAGVMSSNGNGVKTGATNGPMSGTLRTSKTSLGLRIDYAFDAPATGRTTEVRLKVEGNPAGRPLSIEVVPGTGLQMARGLPGNIATQSAASAEHVMAVTPTTDGLHYIHIFLRSGDMSEALAIAVPTGKTQSLTPSVATKTQADGRRVKSIPAQP